MVDGFRSLGLGSPIKDKIFIPEFTDIFSNPGPFAGIFSGLLDKNSFFAPHAHWTGSPLEFSFTGFGPACPCILYSAEKPAMVTPAMAHKARQ